MELPLDDPSDLGQEHGELSAEEEAQQEAARVRRRRQRKQRRWCPWENLMLNGGMFVPLCDQLAEMAQEESDSGLDGNVTQRELLAFLRTLALSATSPRRGVSACAGGRDREGGAHE